MAERFKLKFSRVIPSLQICRQKHLSASVHTPVPAIYGLPPVNSKVFDISFPANNNLPVPPTTKEGHFVKRHVSTTKVLSIRTQELSSEWSFRSPEYTWKKKEAALCHVTVSKDHEPKHNKKKTIASVSSLDRGYFSSEEEHESEALISASTRSLSNYSSTELDHSPDSETRKKKKATVAAGVVSQARASVFRRTMPGTVDGKVKESVAVVKKSVDPYEDFKKSMLEMILQKQMFEAKDLEQLLLCFLSLNSKKYHEVIVQAFSDVWEILFCD